MLNKTKKVQKYYLTVSKGLNKSSWSTYPEYLKFNLVEAFETQLN
jgi:hypothetical protein